MLLTIITIIYILISIITITIWIKNWNIWRGKERDMDNHCKDNDKLKKKLHEKDIAHEHKISEFTRNANNQIAILETEINSLEETIQILKTQKHQTQIDSNNKWHARDIWKQKFGTLENVIWTKGFWKEIMNKYRKNWKHIKLTYNKTKKWTNV